jgi:PIN domain nuclease of toxin-antitoxin system
MSKVVLDSSAILAYLRREPGADTLAGLLPNAAVSTVNIAEVLGRLIGLGHSLEDARRAVDILSMRHVPLDEALAADTAALLPITKRFGLSLGDRACLALALSEGLPVLTSDQAWAPLDIGVQIRMIR